MRNPATQDEPPRDLRQRIEQGFRASGIDFSTTSAMDIGELIEELAIRSEELCSVQKELQAARDNYLDLYEFASVGYITLDASGDIVDANLTVAAMLGVDRAKLIGQHLAQRFASPARVRLNACLAEAFSHRADLNCDLEFDGCRTWHIALHIRDSEFADDGEVTCRLTITDITASDHAKNQKQKSEEELRIRDLAFESSPTGILITDARQPDNPIVYCNPAFELITGYPAEEVCGRNCRFLQGDKRLQDNPREQAELQKLRQALREGRETHVVLRNYRKDGSVFWNELYVGPVRNEMGQVTHFVGIQNDITARKEAERLAREKDQRLQTEMRERQRVEDRLRSQEKQLAHVARACATGEMAAGIAHEINQPLHAISNFATACELRLSRQGSDQCQDVLPMVRQIAELAVRSGEIIRRIRGFVSRAETSRANINLRDVINESIQLMASEAKRLKVDVKVIVEETLPNIVADWVQIQQVLVNLIKNAYEATCTVTCERAVTVRAFAVEDSVNVVVEDSGTGLAPEIASRIFEAFHSSKPDGLGLGLAITRSIVEQHGGKIWVSSNSDRGSEFCFALPIAR